MKIILLTILFSTNLINSQNIIESFTFLSLEEVLNDTNNYGKFIYNGKVFLFLNEYSNLIRKENLKGKKIRLVNNMKEKEIKKIFSNKVINVLRLENVELHKNKLIKVSFAIENRKLLKNKVRGKLLYDITVSSKLLYFYYEFDTSSEKWISSDGYVSN